MDIVNVSFKTRWNPKSSGTVVRAPTRASLVTKFVDLRRDWLGGKKPTYIACRRHNVSANQKIEIDGMAEWRREGGGDGAEYRRGQSLIARLGI